MEGKTKNIIISIIVTILTIAVVSLGVTYAFFSASISGSESVSTIIAEAGIMKIAVAGGNDITADNIMPDNDNPWGTKTINLSGTNNTGNRMAYRLKIVVDYNTFTKGNMKYTLTGVNTGSNGSVIPSVTTQTVISAAAGESQILGTTDTAQGYFLNAENKIHTYTFKIFYENLDIDQSEDMGKEYGAHIIVESVKSE